MLSTTSTTLVENTSPPNVTTIVKVNNSNGKNTIPVTPPSYGSVCLLCLRTKTCTSVKSDPEKHLQSRLMCLKYVVLVSRYLKLDTELTKISQNGYFNANVLKEGNHENDEVAFKEEINKFVICDLCLPLAESFCKTYHEYELIRMKLESKILESTTCVQKSEALGESLKALRGIKRSTGSSKSESNQCKDVLMDFRSTLKAHGSDFVKQNGLRLQLKRDNKVEELVRKKLVPKIRKNSATSNKISDPTTSASDAVSTQRPNPSVKIVRRAGTQLSGPDINIIRVADESLPSVETNNNDSDIQVLGIVPKQKDALNIVPTSITGTYTTNPNFSVERSKTLLPVTTLILDPTIFKPSTLAPNSHSHQSYGQVSMSTSSSVLPISIQTQKCNINGCGVTFPKTEQGLLDIQSHLNTHIDLMCTKCPELLKNPFDLISHELKHEESNSNRKVKQGFQCPRCPHYSAFRIEFQEHFLERHMNTKIQLLKCSICKKGFSHLKLQQYRTHTANCHPNENKDDLSLCHSCMICRVYFKKKIALWKHLKNDHRINCKDGPHKCSDCTESFYFNNLLQLHREFACENRKTFECPDPGCFATFPRIGLIKRHLAKVHNDSDFRLGECPICKLKVYDKNALRLHLQSHNGEQVKLIFGEGENSEAQVIPVESGSNILNSSFTSTVNTLPLNHTENNLNRSSVPSTPNVTIPSSGMELPVASSPTPVILSVSGTPQNYGAGCSLAVPSLTHDLATTHNQTQPVELVHTELDNKMFEMFFDESNDSDETLMEFIENAISEDGTDDVQQPDEDPFAWMLTEDFEIS